MVRTGKRRPGRRRPVRLRVSHEPKLSRYVSAILHETYFIQIAGVLVVLWLAFGAGVWLAERGVEGSLIRSYGDALYWGIAAFSTAGIADTPVSGVAKFVGGCWIVIGSLLFFGTIVATITGYFMRPLQTPAHQIIETIEYNLEHLEDLSEEELELLRKTTDSLIENVEQLKAGKVAGRREKGQRRA